MTGYVKIDLPTNTEPQPEWPNQLRVALAMGKRYEQRHELGMAADCYETVLHLDPGDAVTRVRLSRCYQKMQRLPEAVDHQARAMRDDPGWFHAAVNEACVDCETGEFEKGLLGFVECFRRWKLSPHCNRGLLKINQIMENTLPATNGITECLAATILKMAQDDTFFHESAVPVPAATTDKTTKSNPFREAHVERIQNANYLRYVIENVEFYEEQLKDLPNANVHDKLIYEQIREIVHTFKKVKNDLYDKNPFYMFPCQRPNRRLEDRRKVKDDIKLQVSKYVNAVMEHCLAGDIRSAQRQAELAMNYMEKSLYRPLRMVNTLYEALGLAVFLVNQDVPKWSNEMNEKRMLFILGSSIPDSDSYRHVYQQSYFGPSDVNNTRETLKKFTRQLKDAELSTYNLYLQHERIKCYFTQKDFNEIKPLSRQMYIDAHALGSIAWQVNALMTSLITESRLGNTQLCMKNLEFMIPLSRTLGNKNVTEFMRKIWKLFAENRVKVHVMGSEEVRRADLVDIMPDSNTASYMRKLLHGIVKLP